MVTHLDLDAGIHQRRHDRLAKVAERIGRWDREVAFLVANLVSEVRELLAAAVPGALDAVDVVVAGIRRGLVEAHVVEQEELGFGPHERGVAEACLA